MKRSAWFALIGLAVAGTPGCNWGREGDLTAEEKNGLRNPELHMPATARIGGPPMVRRGGKPLGATEAPGPPETMEAATDAGTMPGGPPEAGPDRQESDAPSAPKASGAKSGAPPAKGT
ncbi:MAG: hypothetical protein KIS66_14085 [Fimbriimonadaceae bacterium]|nr:hypothetical protein [Fimbriimonadaceae bacterium]